MSVCFVCCVHESPVDANFLILSRRKMSLNSGKCAEMDVKAGADQIQKQTISCRFLKRLFFVGEYFYEKLTFFRERACHFLREMSFSRHQISFGNKGKVERLCKHSKK